MHPNEIEIFVHRYEAGQLAGEDAPRLLNEVLRLRNWLAFAEENMSYPGAQSQLWEALAGERAQPDYG
jgi:hypothetical protein